MGVSPLVGHEWAEAVKDDEGNEIGVVSIPLGAREPRPIMVALHGGSDRPGWACGEWRGASSAHSFIVCPRGVGPPERLWWSTTKDTLERIERTTRAVEKTFAPWVDAKSERVLAGFSAGAIQVALIARTSPSPFKTVVISEGGYDQVEDPSFAAAAKRAGVERVLFSCTTAGRCGQVFGNALAPLARHGVDARLNLAGNLGHGLSDPAVRSLRRDWPWLVEGRWQGFTPFAEDKPAVGRTITPGG
jgi:hypothetical protein